MNPPPNLLADLPAAAATAAGAGELFQALLEAPGLRIERIVSHGHASPEGFWYDQDTHEWVLLLRGAARLRFEDEPGPREMTPGSYVAIAAHRRHRVEWTDPTQPTVWLAVHYADRPLIRQAKEERLGLFPP